MADDPAADLRARSGLDVGGVFAFGDGPTMADELLDRVRHGPKRATAGDDDPPPAPGQLWGVLDGAGEPQLVIETLEVTRGRVGDVTPAFAWDEGEDDRTRESWLEGHRRFFGRQGVGEPDELAVHFERFRVVWPVADETDWVADGVRELCWDEREWFGEAYRQRWGATLMVSHGVAHDVAALPGLVCERDGQRLGVLTFRPRPGGDTECVTVDAFARGVGAGAALTMGIAALGRRHGWRRLWLITTNDNTTALRAYQRHGWDLVPCTAARSTPRERSSPRSPPPATTASRCTRSWSWRSGCPELLVLRPRGRWMSTGSVSSARHRQRRLA